MKRLRARSRLDLVRGRPRSREAVSIPLVVVISSVLFIMLVSYTVTRTTVKKQFKKTMGQVKATYMAKAGIQHAILKLRILPNEGYKAGALARGICPFTGTPTTADQRPLDFYISDLHSRGSVKRKLGGAEDSPNNYVFDAAFLGAANDDTATAWSYGIEEMNVLASQVTANSDIQALEIKMIGTSVHNIAGVEVEFKDRVTKVVQSEVAR